ncbi:MAG: hypothetical protein ACRDPY_29800 [Streptosporangiaceae bacterium]
MPGIDEDVVCALLNRCTDDLHAPAAVTAAIIRRHRRRRLRNRALGAVVTGAAAGTAFAVVASAPGGVPRPAPGRSASALPVTTPALRLTAAQRALYGLSSAAAAASKRPAGRYVEMTEKQDGYDKTSIIDSLTGDIWTYQQGAGVPDELPVDRHGSPTEAAFDAMPTDPSALRAVLLAQARQQQAQAQALEQRILAEHGKKGAFPAAAPGLTADDLVFGQATTMLWNPLVGPALRAALYKVLAETPGVQVRTGATDALGRAAVEISRYDSAARVDEQTFEDPQDGTVLETAFIYTAEGTQGTDLYLSVSGSNTLPSNPYQH